MLRKTLFTSAALASLLAGSAVAQSQGDFLTPDPTRPASRAGTRGANFLGIGVGARAQALGGAFTGLASGATSMYWNSAGLGAISTLNLAFSRTDLYGDLGISHTFAAAAIPVFGGGLGVSYNRLDSGTIPRTDEDNPDGGNVVFGDVFEWQGTAVGVHYGRRLTDRLAVGFAGKVISEGMNGASANWWGVDIGTQFNVGLYGLTIGAALNNVGPSARIEGALVTRRLEVFQQDVFPVDVPMRFSTRPAQLPTVFRFSVVSNVAGGPDALTMPSGRHNLRVALEFSDAVDTDLQSALGAEYHYNNLVFLRGGKRWVNEDRSDFRESSFGWSFGGGVRLPFLGRHFSFDYAYTAWGELENVQVFSFEIGN